VLRGGHLAHSHQLQGRDGTRIYKTSTSCWPPALHPRLDWPADLNFLEPDNLAGCVLILVVRHFVLPVFGLAEPADARSRQPHRTSTGLNLAVSPRAFVDHHHIQPYAAAHPSQADRVGLESSRLIPVASLPYGRSIGMCCKEPPGLLVG
jgi:hypothetical protein